ncbi:MAG: aminoglycoside resistance protein, partial [Propionibacteriales bacterium]|nr:aminoglycoside resistance protein [Propionibacteriales bacterium]
HGYCAIVVPVRTADGTVAALKVGWPHEEAEHEHLALRDWKGRGAVRLLRADPARSTLLLERLHTTDLTSVDVAGACQIVAGLYRRLHISAPAPLMRLSGNAARWSAELLALPRSAPVPRRYVEQAAALARDFAVDPGTDGVLIHGDLHYDNVLAADREPWLAIDPKPMSGDPTFEVAPLLWNRWNEVVGSGNARSAVRERFRTVVDAAEFDEDRARDWIVVRELVNVLWTLKDVAAAETGYRQMSAADSDWITTALTIVKAVQD